MRLFHYSAIKDQKWDSDILGLIAAHIQGSRETGTVFETAAGRTGKAH